MNYGLTLTVPFIWQTTAGCRNNVIYLPIHVFFFHSRTTQIMRKYSLD